MNEVEFLRRELERQLKAVDDLNKMVSYSDGIRQRHIQTKEWKKLTIDEIVNLAKLHLYVIYGINESWVGGAQEFAKAINDKLKDKNK
jgi:hypothetical protein